MPAASVPAGQSYYSHDETQRDESPLRGNRGNAQPRRERGVSGVHEGDYPNHPGPRRVCRVCVPPTFSLVLVVCAMALPYLGAIAIGVLAVYRIPVKSLLQR